ncbi:MAG: hypothetical protein WCC78_01460, partial [Terriglobales bacterium]
MRQRHFDSVAFLALAFALAANSSAATALPSTASHWTVVIQPARLVNGTPLLFRVTTLKPVHT